MKTPTLLLLLLMLSAVDGGSSEPDAGAPAPAMLLEITGVRNDKGHLLLALYRPGDGFSETKPTAFRKEAPPANAGTMRVEIKDLPVGTYAIALIHDENDNLKIDTGFLGIPIEGFCFSRGAMGVFGPPSFNDAAVSHPIGGGTQKLVVKY